MLTWNSLKKKISSSRNPKDLKLPPPALRTLCLAQRTPPGGTKAVMNPCCSARSVRKCQDKQINWFKNASISVNSTGMKDKTIKNRILSAILHSSKSFGSQAEAQGLMTACDQTSGVYKISRGVRMRFGKLIKNTNTIFHYTTMLYT